MTTGKEIGHLTSSLNPANSSQPVPGVNLGFGVENDEDHHSPYAYDFGRVRYQIAKITEAISRGTTKGSLARTTVKRGLLCQALAP